MGEVELTEALATEQEAHDVAIGGGEETDDIAIVVDTCCCDVGATRDQDFCEMSRSTIEAEAVIDALSIGIEANGDPMIVKAEDLVDGSCASIWVFVGSVDAIPLDEAKVVAIAIDPEACGVAVVVDGGDLCLDGAREVLIAKVVLMIGWDNAIAFVRVKGPIDDCPTTEVACDFAVVVDAEQLVEGRVGLVVDGLEFVGST